LRKDPRRRLSELRKETDRLRERLAVLDEQLAYQQGVADDAEADAAVKGTPLAEREERAAKEDARRTRRERDEIARRLEKLAAEQDELLEGLAETAGTERGSDS
jgi:flagellar biosynthesis chaperone FliJ